MDARVAKSGSSRSQNLPSHRLDDRKYYALETYLFTDVTARFKRTKCISTFDFFCIVIWKANRSKSRIARLLRSKGKKSLDAAIRSLVSEIVSAESRKARMRVLIRNWGLRLPMASAILAVLYPSSFPVYDERVCDAINDFHDAKQLTNFDRLWDRYEEFLARVNEVRRRDWTLRDADRFLWGQSFRLQLQRDLASGFR